MKHPLTPLQIGLIRRAMYKHSNATYVGRMFSLPKKLIDDVMANRVMATVVPPCVETDHYRQFGPEALMQFMIGRKPIEDGEWCVEDSASIEESRVLYDAGDVDMMQAKTTKFFILYAVPRRDRDLKRRPYFSVIHGEG
jgi:hypothetical protein